MSIYSSTHPKFLNKQTEVYALGLAVGPSNAAYYFSVAGPNQAINSIWAGLTKNSKKATVHATPWHKQQMRSPGPGMKKAYYKVPNSSYGHIACKWTDPTLIAIIHPQGRTLLDAEDTKRQQWLQENQDDITEQAAARLYHYIAKHHPAPVLPEWKRTLFDYAQENGGLIPLQTYGDCVAAYIIKPELDNDLTWTQLVARMVALKKVTFGASSKPGTAPKELSAAQKSKLIAEQNDQFRKSIGDVLADISDIPGTIVMTAGVQHSDPDIRRELFEKVENFEQHYEFTRANDPYGEHDAGWITIERPDPSLPDATIKYRYMWKIDYYQAGSDYEYGAEEPHIPVLTERVLTIMKAEEY